MRTKTPNSKGFFRGFFSGVVNFFHAYLVSIYWLLHQNVKGHKEFKEIVKKPGDMVVVTGGTRGIGLEVVKQLLTAGMKVIIACRDPTFGNKVIAQLREDGITSGSAKCMQLDLSSLHSVKQFAKTFLEMGIPLNVLINNAGIMWVPFKLTVDGFESMFQVNYLSHFLLTLLLLPALIRAGSTGNCSRVVHVSSIHSLMGKVDFDDLLTRKNYDRHLTYCNTKLMQSVSSNYLNKRFISEQLPVRSYAVHPGAVYTDILKHLILPHRLAVNILYRIGKSPKQGSDAVVYTVMSDELEGRGGVMVSNFSIISPNPQAMDSKIQNKLWDISNDLTKLHQSKQNKDIVFLDPDPFTAVNIV